MKRYERILVCIDRAQRDARMLTYAGAIARLAETKEIYVLHVSEEEGRAPSDPLAESAVEPEVTPESLAALVDEHFQGHGGESCRCEVVSGTPLMEVLRFAHDQDVDLIVVGRQFGQPGEADEEAVQARRITRKSACSVLVLPENYQIQADTILVPVRNSECSANALDVACGIAVATEATVIAYNVCQVYSGYTRVGTTLGEHQALLEQAAQRECDELLERVNTRSVQVKCECALDALGRPVPIILQAIADMSADLVVIGARGRSGAAGVLLGKVTEQLIRESPVPVLAVKKKGECLGILRALLTLGRGT